jgi:hypothetical protein
VNYNLFSEFVSYRFALRSLPADLAELCLKWEFTFGKKHGIVLIMIKPVLKKFDRNGNLRPLLELMDKELRGKILVTETVTCDAYALIVSRGRDQSASISTVASHRTIATPSPSPPSAAKDGVAQNATVPASSVQVRMGATLSWDHSSTAGVWKVGSEPGCTYMPLLELSMLRSWWRNWSNDPVTKRTFDGIVYQELPLKDPDNPFASFLPPWGPLDENGEEVPKPEASFSNLLLRERFLTCRSSTSVLRDMQRYSEMNGFVILL